MVVFMMTKIIVKIMFDVNDDYSNSSDDDDDDDNIIENDVRNYKHQ